MRHAIAAKSIADLDTASAKMTEMGLGAEPLAKEGLELKDFLVKQVRPLPCLAFPCLSSPCLAPNARFPKLVQFSLYALVCFGYLLGTVLFLWVSGGVGCVGVFGVCV
jgi:hypothetical protein